MHTQVVLLLRWLRHRLDVCTLAGEAGLSIATAYRYLREALDVIAGHAPDLADVLTRARRGALPFLCLDGTLVPTDRVAARAGVATICGTPASTTPSAVPCRCSVTPVAVRCRSRDVRPGSTHDITTPRGLPVLADKGYGGARVGIHMPAKGAHLAPSTATRNRLLTRLRAEGERGIALLKTQWQALRHVRLCPQRISKITAAALVLTIAERPSR